MRKEILLEIGDNYKSMADEISSDEIFSAVGGFVKMLCALCEKNDIDLQIDIYGSSNNNTTMCYDYTYENAD